VDYLGDGPALATTVAQSFAKKPIVSMTVPDCHIYRDHRFFAVPVAGG
jgi:hypothetical protein